MEGSMASAFDAYVEVLIDVIGHVDRAEPLRDYCTGLMMPVKRKSVEPLAAVMAPSRVSAKHQSLLHFVGQAPWSDEALMGRVRDWVLPRMIKGGGPITAWIIDDTGFPKKGNHSVGRSGWMIRNAGKKQRYQTRLFSKPSPRLRSIRSALRSLHERRWALCLPMQVTARMAGSAET